LIFVEKRQWILGFIVQPKKAQLIPSSHACPEVVLIAVSKKTPILLIFEKNDLGHLFIFDQAF
jgi:hypothetical protein